MLFDKIGFPVKVKSSFDEDGTYSFSIDDDIEHPLIFAKNYIWLNGNWSEDNIENISEIDVK